MAGGAGWPEVRAGLRRHRAVLARELREGGALSALAERGLLGEAGEGQEEQVERLLAAASALSAERLEEFCGVLQRECPALTRALLRDTDLIANGYHDNTKENMVKDYNLNRESPRSRRSVSQCSCNTTASRRSSMASPPPPQLNNTVEMYVEPVVEDIYSADPRYEERSDQWTQNEASFEELLTSLTQATDTPNEEKLHSGVSLEVKSKKSKARVHYHKFTRGKDLSRYSEKDLANIFGKKTLKDEKEKEDSENTDEKGDPIFTEQVFTEGGNMKDYFNKKLELLGKTVNKIEHDLENVDHGFNGLSNGADAYEGMSQGFGFKPFSSSSGTEENTAVADNVEVNISEEKENNLTKKKKKNKDKVEAFAFKQFLSSNEAKQNTAVTDNAEVNISEKENSSKKKKIKTDKFVSEVSGGNSHSAEVNEVQEDCPEETSQKRKKKKKDKFVKDIEEPMLNVDVVLETSVDIKKSKKKKSKVIDETAEPEVIKNAEPEDDNSNSFEERAGTKKKKSKRKPQELLKIEQPFKKKKNKNKNKDLS